MNFDLSIQVVIAFGIALVRSMHVNWDAGNRNLAESIISNFTGGAMNIQSFMNIINLPDFDNSACNYWLTTSRFFGDELRLMCFEQGQTVLHLKFDAKYEENSTKMFPQILIAFLRKPKSGKVKLAYRLITVLSNLLKVSSKSPKASIVLQATTSVRDDEVGAYAWSLDTRLEFSDKLMLDLTTKEFRQRLAENYPGWRPLTKELNNLKKPIDFARYRIIYKGQKIEAKTFYYVSCHETMDNVWLFFILKHSLIWFRFIR